MVRKRNFLLFMIAAFVLGGLALRVALRPLVETFKARLVSGISGALSMHVRFEGVGLAVAPGLELVIKDLSAGNAGVEALHVKEVRVKLRLRPLLKKTVSILRVTIEQPEVSLLRRPDGSFNFTGPRGPASKKSVLIPKLVIYRGRLSYTDEKTGRGFMADGIELYMDDLVYGGRLSDGALRKLSFKGNLKCASFKSGNLAFKDLALSASAAQGVLKIDPFKVNAFGVDGGGNLRADVASGVTDLKFFYFSDWFRLEDVLPLAFRSGSGLKALRGLAQVRAELSARGNDYPELRGSLSGPVFADGEDLVLPPAAGGPRVTAEKASAVFASSPMARGEIRLSRLLIEKPQVLLVRGKNGARQPQAGTPKPAAAAKPLVIDEFKVSEGTLVYDDETGGEILHAEDVGFSLKGFSYGARSGDKFATRFVFNGDVKCSTLAVGGLNFNDVAMKASARKGAFDLDSLSLGVFRGTGTGRLRANLAPSRPAYKLAFDLRHFRVGEFLQSFSREKGAAKVLLGRVDLQADASARGNNSGELKHTFIGRFALRGENLRLPGMDTDEVISKYVRSQNFNLLDVGAFLLVGPLGPAVTKSYNFADAGLSRGKNGTIRRLSQVWNVKGGTAVAEDAALSTDKYRLAMKGGVDLADGHFEDFTLAVLDKRGCADYAQSIQGTFSRPQIGKFTMLQSLAGPVISVVGGVVGTVQKLIPGLDCDPFYTGSVPQP